MHKELNPELFGERSGAKGRAVEPGTYHSIGDSSFLNVDQKIFDISKQIQNLTEQINKMSAQMNDLLKINQAKVDKVALQVSRLEINHNGLAQEASQKIAQIGSKMGERRTMDLKIQEMVDRHNNVLKSFEVRLNQLQKVLNEKEAHLMATTAALNDAKMEIARLKRF